VCCLLATCYLLLLDCRDPLVACGVFGVLGAHLLLPARGVDMNRNAMNELSRTVCRRSNPGMSHCVAPITDGAFTRTYPLIKKARGKRA
ncbi:hypothetical protein ACOTCQ_27170, partial [Achromobacter dolens]|uniref:hypothetical protein n=1 Tax=Achromobacter dolens TaxID=1287738 RepID=UPI003B9CCFF7